MTTKIATSILAKRRRIKAARGQSYASNPGGSTAAAPTSSSSAKPSTTAGRVAARHGGAAPNTGGNAVQMLAPAGRAGLNTLQGIGTAGVGLANLVGGSIGAGIGHLVHEGGNVLDGIGVTQNAGAATRAARNTYAGAAAAGFKDTLGGLADALSLGYYDHDGSLAQFRAPGDMRPLPAGSAVSQMRSQHRDILGRDSWANTAYNATNAVADFAAETAALGGFGRGANVAAKTVGASQTAAPALNAASKIPGVGAAGRWLAGKAPKYNMFKQNPVEYARNLYGTGPAGAASGLANEAVSAYGTTLSAISPDDPQEHNRQLAAYEEYRKQVAEQYPQVTANINQHRGVHDTHALTNAMAQDPAILNRMAHGGVPLDAASQMAVDGHFEPGTEHDAVDQIAATDIANQEAGGLMQVADQPETNDPATEEQNTAAVQSLGAKQNTPPPEPETFVNSIAPDADPETKAQLTTAAATAQAAVAADPDAGEAVVDPESEKGQAKRQDGFKTFMGENAASAPQDPREAGGWVNDMITQYLALDSMTQVGMGLGLGAGVIGIISSLMGGGGIGSFLMGALGLGAAGAMGAANGMFGDQAQQTANDVMGAITGGHALDDLKYTAGKALGLIPEVSQEDIAPLLGDNPVQQIISDSITGAVSGKGLGVEAAKQKLQQLEQLSQQSPYMVMRILKLNSEEEAQRVLENANKVLESANSGDLKQMLAFGDWMSGGSSKSSAARAAIVKAAAGRCWSGYEPVPGKKPYTAGSCRPAGKKKKKAKQQK